MKNALLLGGTGEPFLVAVKSAASLSFHSLPVHSHSILSGFHGLPLRSALARLYRMRRLFGHAYAHVEFRPMPDASELSRRPMGCSAASSGASLLDQKPE